MVKLTIVQFLIALSMSLGGLCLFIWAVLSGMFNDVEDIAYRTYRREVQNDESND